MVDEKPQPALALLSLSRLPENVLRGWAAALGAEFMAHEPGAALPTARVPLVLVYDSVETALTATMAAGKPPSAALADWEEMAATVLAFWRQRRRITFLLEARSLLAAPAEAAAAVAAWRGTAAPADLPGPGEDEPAAPTPVLSALSALPRLSRRPTRRLCDELAAGGFCAPNDSVDDLDQALAALIEGKTGVPAAPVAPKEATNPLGLSQADLEARLARISARAADAQSALATGEAPATWQGLAAAEVLAQESELRRIQLLSLQEMLENVQRKHATEAQKQANHIATLEMDVLRLRAQLQDRLQSVVALTDANRRLKLELDDRVQEVKAVRSSQSWRITAPLRATRLLLSGKRKPQ